jgi:SulP family sulfate permease
MTSDRNSQDFGPTKGSRSSGRSHSFRNPVLPAFGDYSAASHHHHDGRQDVTNGNSSSFTIPHDRQDTVLSSRRRLSATSRMDASSAMHRLRTSMVGRTSASHEWDDQETLSRRTSFSTDDEGKGTATDPATPLSPSLSDPHPRFSRDRKIFCSHWLGQTFGQIPAIALIGIFHLMIGIPFGVSYFPMYWNSHPGEKGPAADEHGGDLPEGFFPIPGKEALGIRMFLFATLVGQVVFSFYSGFPNPIGLQMVENIGFTKALSAVAIAHQGYGLEALATVMLMFAISSVLVGVVFYSLGKFQWGKVVYFFPTHVLIGLIGGIGVLIAKTGIEVTISDTLTIGSVVQQWRLWIVVAGLELFLRFLEYVTTDAKGKPMFSLLSPVFFCMITPLFYLALCIFHVPVSAAKDAGYFFPSLDSAGEDASPSNDVGFGTPWDMWKVRSVICTHNHFSDLLLLVSASPALSSLL